MTSEECFGEIPVVEVSERLCVQFWNSREKDGVPNLLVLVFCGGIGLFSVAFGRILTI